mgnify:CR=1 FL=1
MYWLYRIGYDTRRFNSVQHLPPGREDESIGDQGLVIEWSHRTHPATTDFVGGSPQCIRNRNSERLHGTDC